MAREKALYEGHAVAAVAAIDAATAEEALALIEVDYEVLPHVIDVDEAMKPDAPLLFEDMITRGVEPAPTKPSNVSKRLEFKIGDLDAGFAAGRRDRREGVQDRGGAPGLYRAACLLRARRPRRADRDLVVEPGAFRRPRADRQAARTCRSATCAAPRPRSAAGSAARPSSIWSRSRRCCRRNPGARSRSR